MYADWSCLSALLCIDSELLRKALPPILSPIRHSNSHTSTSLPTLSSSAHGHTDCMSPCLTIYAAAQRSNLRRAPLHRCHQVYSAPPLKYDLSYTSSTYSRYQIISSLEHERYMRKTILSAKIIHHNSIGPRQYQLSDIHQ